MTQGVLLLQSEGPNSLEGASVLFLLWRASKCQGCVPACGCGVDSFIPEAPICIRNMHMQPSISGFFRFRARARVDLSEIRFQSGSGLGMDNVRRSSQLCTVPDERLKRDSTSSQTHPLLRGRWSWRLKRGLNGRKDHEK